MNESVGAIFVCSSVVVYRQQHRRPSCMIGLVSMGDRCMCHLAAETRNRGRRRRQFLG